MKQILSDSRFDFRGGRNTAISTDLLNTNELVDCTNTRLSEIYGGFTKRTGSQRMHSTAFPGPIRGVTQWDTTSGKQTVVISSGRLYWRNGFDFSPAFTIASSPSVNRTTANQGTSAGWVDPDISDDGINTLSVGAGGSSTVVAADRLLNKLGDPAVDSNVDAADDKYTLSFRINGDASAVTGVGVLLSTVTLEFSTDNGASYNPLPGTFVLTVAAGNTDSQKFTTTVTISGAPTHVWIRLILNVQVTGGGGLGVGSVQCFDTVYKTDNFPVTWVTGAAQFSLTDPAFFVPFRDSSSGAPLRLFIASGGHYFKWDPDAMTLTQLDPTNQAPLATLIMSYHTRMFAVDANFKKTIFWSKIGDPTDFTTGDKSQGGSALTDFLTGQELTALEVIGSSLLMATKDSVMRFTGHASDDIVISQDTEGISAEVGAVGPQCLKRYENVAAMLSERGPYVVTETYAQPSGEQLNPDWLSLQQQHLSDSSIEYNRSRKELLFAVHGANDGDVHKTVFSQSVRLQAWQGPWNYPFGITCMSKYFNNASDAPIVIAGCDDGFIRLLDEGSLDDVLFDGTGGSPINMVVELPILHFGLPGVKKTLKWMLLQANLPLTSNLKIRVAFDGGTFQDFPVTPNDNGEEYYRVDLGNPQGFRCRVQFVEGTNQPITVHGFTLLAWNMQRTT